MSLHLGHLGLDLSNVTEIPMRWIKGDTPSHIDRSSTKFDKTYLVYINDSDGNFVLDTTFHKISSNTAFVFNEGILHKTENTGIVPRLLLGPMNESAGIVGDPTVIYYFSNQTDADSNSSSIAYSNVSNVDEMSSIILVGSVSSGSIGGYTQWRFSTYSTNNYGIVSNGYEINYTTGDVYYLYPASACFLEGTKVLSLINNEEIYVEIENLQRGDLVKTSMNGYKKIELIGKNEINNPENNERIEDRLYKCTPQKYPELNNDLYITGCHSILVNTLNENERKQTIEHLGKIYVTDRKYRLIACVDERAEPWNVGGTYNVWHLALENADIKMNYGIYVNGGLLVESCSICFLKTKSNMTLL